MMNLERIPVHMREAVRAYVEDRLPPGSFLLAVLANNLVEAFAQADDLNEVAMRQWAALLYNELPSDCWGSHKTVEGWLNPEGAAK